MDKKKSKSFKVFYVLFAMLLISLVFTGCSVFGSPNIVYIYQTGDTGGVVNTKDGLIETIDNIEDSVVEVYARTSDGISCGSGVLIDTTNQEDTTLNRRYFVVTNFHVIDSGYAIQVNFTRLDKKFNAQLVGGDEQSDIAVLMFETTECANNCECKTTSTNNPTPCTSCDDKCKCGCTFKGVKFADSDNLKLGQTCIVIGNPLGSLGGSVSIGNISYLNRVVTVENLDMTLIQTTATINSGNSGGGMFDTNGNLIGIVNAKASGTGVEGIGFAIPSNEVMDKCSQLIATSKINDNGVVTDYGYIQGRTNFGITATYSNNTVYVASISTTSAFYGLQGTYSTSENGQVYGRAKINTNDKIVSINKVVIANLDNFVDSISNLKIGDSVKIVVIRTIGYNDYYITVTATLSQYCYEMPTL